MSSNYVVTYAKGDTTPKTIDVADESYVDKLPIDLFGRNATQYGDGFWTNLVRIVENFYSVTEPRNPIKGQLWYNGTNLYLCTKAASTLVTQSDYAANYTTYKSDASWSTINLAAAATSGNGTVTQKYVDDKVANLLTGITGDISIDSTGLAKVTGINNKKLSDPTSAGQIMAYNGSALVWTDGIFVSSGSTGNAAINVNGTITSKKQPLNIDSSTTNIQLIPATHAGITNVVTKNCLIANNAWQTGHWFKLFNNHIDDVTVTFNAGTTIKISNGVKGGVIINVAPLTAKIPYMICAEFIYLNTNEWLVIGNVTA